jgi:hypothetical protein
VYIKFNAYYYVAPEKIRDPQTKELKTWVRICSVEDGEATMLNCLADLLGGKAHVQGTVPHLCTEFKLHKLGKYGWETQEQYTRFRDVIADEFDAFLVVEVTTKEFADFLREKFADKPNTARKYGGLASKLFRYAVSGLGLRQDNPIDPLDPERLRDAAPHRADHVRPGAAHPRGRHAKQGAQGHRQEHPDCKLADVRLHHRHGLSAVGVRDRHLDVEGIADRGRVYSTGTQQDYEEQREGSRHPGHASHRGCDRARTRHQEAVQDHLALPFLESEGDAVCQDWTDIDVG